MNGRLTRREMLKASGGALAGAWLLGLVGCGPGGQGNGNAELRMSWWGSTERNKRTKEALALFRERNPKTRVSTEYTGDFEEYWNRLATQASGGNAPDVMQTDYRYLTEYAGRGVLLELDEYIPEPVNLENFDQKLLEGGKIDGKIYGVTMGNNSQTVIYDVARFEEVGAGTPDNEWTWEDLAEISRQLSEAGGDGVWGTADGGGSEPFLEVFLRQRGQSLYDGGRLGFDREALAEWWTYWDDLRRSGAAAPAAVMAEGANALESTPMLTGKTATTFQWSNQYTAFSALTERELGIATVPNGPEGSGQYLKPSMLLSAYSRTDYPEESGTLIDFLLNDPEANEILGTERGISGNSEIRERLKADSGEVERRIFEYLDYVSGVAPPLPPPPPQGAGEIDALLIRTYENVAFGRLSIDKAVDRFFDEAQRILEQTG